MQQNMKGPNIIITEPSSSLRTLGRNALVGKWKVAIIAFIIYTLCLNVPTAILDALFGVNVGSLYNQNAYDVNVDVYNNIYNNLPKDAWLGDVYILLVAGAFALGLSLFFLGLFRKQAVAETDIFLGFERFGKALGLMMFQILFIFLWSCLFIIPGIIAAIKYSQAFFILADDPNKGIRQCMNESKAMMHGNKAKYFWLSLSFIGWIILSSFVVGVIAGVGAVLFPEGFLNAIVVIIASLAMVPVNVYMYSTQAGFYEILAGHLIKETEPAPVAPEARPFVNQPAGQQGRPVPQAPQQQEEAPVPQAPQQPAPPETNPTNPKDNM